VSLSSARNVVEVIDETKYDVLYVAILKNGNWIMDEDAEKYLKTGSEDGIETQDDIAEFVQMAKDKKIDLVLPILHGAYGEDGRLQGFLDVLSVPYVFSSHSAHALAMDKAKAKNVVESFNVKIIPGLVVQKEKGFDVHMILKEISLPLVVKPNEAGSSVGISLVEKEDDLQDAINLAFEHGDTVIVEKKIDGRELTVGVIEIDGEKKILPIVEIIPKSNIWYDYKAKYEEGGSEHVCPAKVSSEVEKIAKENAQKAYDAIGCKDLARADFLLDEINDVVYFLEINTIPGMTSTSLAPDAARVEGIEFDELINSLIDNNIR
ncbi:MAG: D-alanine--D-alanine ligase, partial [Patescibacteria group bacterium]